MESTMGGIMDGTMGNIMEITEQNEQLYLRTIIFVIQNYNE